MDYRHEDFIFNKGHLCGGGTEDLTCAFGDTVSNQVVVTLSSILEAGVPSSNNHVFLTDASLPSASPHGRQRKVKSVPSALYRGVSAVHGRVALICLKDPALNPTWKMRRSYIQTAVVRM